MSVSRTRLPRDHGQEYADVSLREFIQAQLDALALLVNERDKQYETRFRASEIAVNAALAAQEKAVAAAFTASEKAIVKAEQAQKEYNERSNEFRGQLDDQAKLLMPRSEYSVQHRALEDRVEDLRQQIVGLQNARSTSTGSSVTIREFVTYGIAAAAIVATILVNLLK